MSGQTYLLQVDVNCGQHVLRVKRTHVDESQFISLISWRINFKIGREKKSRILDSKQKREASNIGCLTDVGTKPDKPTTTCRSGRKRTESTQTLNQIRRPYPPLSRSDVSPTPTLIVEADLPSSHQVPYLITWERDEVLVHRGNRRL